MPLRTSGSDGILYQDVTSRCTQCDYLVHTPCPTIAVNHTNSATGKMPDEIVNRMGVDRNIDSERWLLHALVASSMGCGTLYNTSSISSSSTSSLLSTSSSPTTKSPQSLLPSLIKQALSPLLVQSSSTSSSSSSSSTVYMLNVSNLLAIANETPLLLQLLSDYWYRPNYYLRRWLYQTTLQLA